MQTESSEIITTITRRNSILRYIQGIADQHLPVRLACGDDENSKVYRTQIARIANEDDKIVIHQPKPADWQKHITGKDSLIVTCRMPNGTIKFHGNLSLLEDNENSPYCQLSLPTEISKKQLRSDFRVSVLKYGSKIELTLPDIEKKYRGICNDISLGGVLVHLPYCDLQLQKGDEIDELHLHIPGIIDLRCAARICRATEVDGTGVFMGLSFEALLPKQDKELRSALIRLERRNIKTDPF